MAYEGYFEMEVEIPFVVLEKYESEL